MVTREPTQPQFVQDPHVNALINALLVLVLSEDTRHTLWNEDRQALMQAVRALKPYRKAIDERVGEVTIEVLNRVAEGGCGCEPVI